jgi:hypothetical protein
MTAKKKWFRYASMVIFATFVLHSPALAENTISVEGVVGEDFLIIADDGTVYRISDTTMGDEVAQLFNKKVRVTGIVEDWEGMKMITVTSYEIIEDQAILKKGALNS